MTSVRRYKAVFLLPGLLTLFFIIIFPLLFTIRVSFSSWNVSSPELDFIGGANFARMLQDERFRASILHLFVLAGGSVALQYLLGFALALAVWRDVRGRRFLRVLFLVPMMTTPVVMAAIWQMIFHESLGPVNDVLTRVGLDPVGWLTSSTPSYVSLMTVEVWQWTPFMFLLLLAGLLSLPHEPFMAAAIDGAGPVRTFFKVTLPLMAPVSVTALIIRLIEASKMSDSIYVLTSGGPGSATETPGYYLYIRGLKEQQTGYSGALSITYLVLMIVTLTIVSALLVRAFRTKVD
ncbi:carbohydrate ABC transporter permease [Intrasporangium calvum]|uniref:Carbohydrate ABC transporter membrane protein 1, CUT1 family n=1 Tax=Intrasporangium calvum (strain ATCC 23552 / DSM 43043 / JCM 3097 / NBRC 12989 / NCIMB 10167 / NRRL B-3866 / 7 KIP) TaxID=710696 RepID=E6S7J5_INTC7|nr:sugar ABC transporter permease [Intrasporangium calvum]ADU46890.1 carbohydrate ABC transporter membrane protein 1, CUT1 family [Intrasporangium calvum DSM 43043]AXG12170.1 sugar ABC transporter permease [Intrasporangium calvum]